MESSRCFRLTGQREAARRRLLEAIAVLRAADVHSGVETLELAAFDASWGDYDTASTLVEQVLSRLHADAPAKVRVQALCERARVAIARGDVAAARSDLERARDAAQPLMPSASGRTLREVEDVALELALLDADRDALEAVVSHNGGDPRRLLQRGWACWHRNAYEEATWCADAAVAEAMPPWADPDHAVIWARARVLRSLARVAVEDVATAIPCAHDAVRAAAKLGSPRWILHAATSIAQVHVATGRSRLAAAVARRILMDERADAASKRIAARWASGDPHSERDEPPPYDLRPWADELSRSLA